ncbi:MAG: NADH-quinone oxidoreductase subunit B family protein [Bacillota bacterium]|nr:NADH-quinone oxidoreductase subunit B family protein [Bacillota bacterium]
MGVNDQEQPGKAQPGQVPEQGQPRQGAAPADGSQPSPATPAAEPPRPAPRQRPSGPLRPRNERPVVPTGERKPPARVQLLDELGRFGPEQVGFQDAEILPGVWRHAPGILTTNLQTLVNWGRQNSMWYMLFATACCGIELMAFGASRFDADRHGMVPWGSPRHADVMIIAGTITEKMAEPTVRLYEQMAEPRYVISMGVCATNGGPFWQGYNVVDGVDKLIPVDVYVPGCPPRPEALLHAIYRLRQKIARAGLDRARIREGREPEPARILTPSRG